MSGQLAAASQKLLASGQWLFAIGMLQCKREVSV